jgi:hypothetical protein
MDPNQLVGMSITEARGRDRTPISALNRKFRVAKRAAHKCGDAVCDVLDAEAALTRLE